MFAGSSNSTGTSFNLEPSSKKIQVTPGLIKYIKLAKSCTNWFRLGEELGIDFKTLVKIRHQFGDFRSAEEVQKALTVVLHLFFTGPDEDLSAKEKILIRAVVRRKCEMPVGTIIDRSNSGKCLPLSIIAHSYIILSNLSCHQKYVKLEESKGSSYQLARIESWPFTLLYC